MDLTQPKSVSDRQRDKDEKCKLDEWAIDLAFYILN